MMMMMMIIIIIIMCVIDSATVNSFRNGLRQMQQNKMGFFID